MERDESPPHESISLASTSLWPRTFLLPAAMANIWDGRKERGKKKKNKRDWGMDGDSWPKVLHSGELKNTTLGPGGAAGIGCGAGVGFALVGGAGIGSSPWNSLRLAFGIGFGCGLGIGYGYGYGLGFLLDRRQKENEHVRKHIVIKI